MPILLVDTVFWAEAAWCARTHPGRCPPAASAEGPRSAVELCTRIERRERLEGRHEACGAFGEVERTCGPRFRVGVRRCGCGCGAAALRVQLSKRWLSSAPQ